jgi:hypothetical protein
MGNNVPRIKTDVSESQVAQAIIEAWKELFKKEPSKDQVSLILAQNSLETGNRKSMWNYNIGNIKGNPKDNSSSDFFYLKAPEQISPGNWKNLDMAFRAYPTLKDGVIDYIKLLSTSSRYSDAWKHILNPDPVAFSKALKKGGYYTANESDYTKLLSSLFNQHSKSKAYEDAKSGNVKSSPTMVAHKSEPAGNLSQDLLSKVNEFLRQIAATEKNNKKLYKKFLPSNNLVIHINASNYIDAIEFSSVLCSALDEELMATANIHSNDNSVEVDCLIYGPQDDCFETVKQLSNSLANTFKSATTKIGGVNVNVEFSINKKSSYKQLDSNTINNQHRKFLLKFI